MKTLEGYVYKEKRGKLVYWMARVCVTDAEGKRRNLKRSFKTRTEAKLALPEMVRRARELAGGAPLDAEHLTFAEVAKRYSDVKLVAAEYRGERKVKGLRALSTFELFRDVLVEHFGRKKIRNIKHSDIEAFKHKRLDTPTRSGSQRSIASVNRELQFLRTIFIWAQRQGWIEKNPFRLGAPLIDRASEVARTRILTLDEEERLLTACTGNRAHLRPLIIAAIDTGCRRGELFKLTWADVDFEARLIHVRAINAKTNRARNVGMTMRLMNELRQLWESSSRDQTALVFGLTSNVKHSFVSTCKAAGIDDLHFHDLRHTNITRMIQAGMPHTEAMKISGHQTLDMLNRYVNVNQDTARRAAESLDALYQKSQVIESGLVN